MSVGVKLDEAIMRSTGPFCFRIRGELCHLMGALCPEGEEGHTQFAQIYLHDGDTDEAVACRMSLNNVSDPIHAQTWRDLQTMMHAHNPFVQLFLNAKEIIERKPQGERDQISAALHLDESSDKRRYNLPTTREIAVILPSDSREGYSKDLIVRYRNGQLLRLYDDQPTFQPLAYPLLFPKGELGWWENIPYRDDFEGRNNQPQEEAPAWARGQRKAVSRCEYYAYLFHQRVGDAHTILRAGKLFHQFIVDTWAGTEQQRLRWVTNNQKKLCADQYKGLVDSLHSTDTELTNLGKRVILPSSFTMSTHYMHQLFQDSMAICRYYQHPDLFLTFTANPTWPEIQNTLLPGQSYTDRPDLVARVFNLKKKALLEDITKHGILGRVIAHVHTIEFQKRGLPHMHLIIFFKAEDKLRSPADFEHMIRADIPDPQLEPELHQIVTKTMLHDPCGPKCMDDHGRCTKGFPKPFCEATTMNEDGYAKHARPDNGCTHTKHVSGTDMIYTNQHVVPYIPFLSLKYQAHINGEVCISVRGIKYIHKYIYKGQDRTTMIIGNGDEVSQYLDSRYVSAPEACHRIFQFDMHLEQPTVYRLPVHLPNQQQVTFARTRVNLSRVSSEVCMG